MQKNQRGSRTLDDDLDVGDINGDVPSCFSKISLFLEGEKEGGFPPGSPGVSPCGQRVCAVVDTSATASL